MKHDTFDASCRITVYLTEVEERENLRGGSGLYLRLNDGRGGTVQGSGFLRFYTTITKVHVFVPEFFNSSCRKKNQFIKIKFITIYYIMIMYVYHLYVS